MSVLGFYPTRPDAPSLELPAAAVTSIVGGYAWEIPEHAVLEGPPKREWQGPVPPPLQLQISLHAEVHGVRPNAVRAALRAYGDAGEVLEVAASSGRVFGLYMIEEIKVAEEAEEVDEEPLSMRLSVTLVQPGDEDEIAFFTPPTPIALVGSVLGPTTDEPAVDGPYGDASTVTPVEIARR